MRPHNNNNSNNNNNNKNRMRGRGRKPGNSTNRNYESNGPDVKIRGNAGHIAEKYQNLARDALVNGDTVMAENYFQHAEHYSRIVAAAQQSAPQQQRNNNEDRQQPVNGRGPQPNIEGVPAEVALNENAEQPAASEPGVAIEEPPRRASRSRSRSKPVEAEAPPMAEGAAVASESKSEVDGVVEVEPKTRGRTRRPRVKKTEAISDDAAALPDSLTSAPTVEAETPVVVEE